MSNHLHLIISAENNDLSDILRDFKKYTSKEFIKRKYTERVEGSGCLLSSPKKVETTQGIDTINYGDRKTTQRNSLQKNSVGADLVEKPEDYLLSSAKNYYLNEEGVLRVEII